MTSVEFVVPGLTVPQEQPISAGPSAEVDLTARGRALADQAIDEMIAEIRLRASRHLLDRGLRISLPYFDDRRLSLRYWSFTVTPKGRILFVPSFLVLAVERELTRAQQARDLTPSTRAHLLRGLATLGEAFLIDPQARLRAEIPSR
jgi:hypothetical protein